MSSNFDFGQMTRWWWIRHAPVTVNKGTCYGQTDHPCDTSADSHFKGWADLLPKDAVWVHSPLRRTKETALAIGAAGYALPEMQVVPEFIEQHFGSWQGRTYEELKAAPESGYHRFWLGPAAAVPPGGESFEHLMHRVIPGIERLNVEHAGKDIIAVTHGGTIRAAVAHALRLDPEAALRVEVYNTSLTRLDHFAGTPRHPPAWRAVVINQAPR
ncbi:MAG: histidine phosphatase family protein [Alphaproteobacteria bacterium]|nr:histidine phosphatase family protein [Alphaproteobacteria bacterium]